MQPDYELKQFIPATASDAYFAARHTFVNIMHAEMYPEDPPQSLESSINNARGWAEIKDGVVHVWNLWQESEIVAELFAPVMHQAENQHLMHAEVEVIPSHRRQGLTRPLLAKLLEIAKENERSLITLDTFAAVPAGAVLARKLGAEPGLEESENRLQLADLNRKLLNDWQQAATTTARDFELVFLAGDYPDNLIDKIVDLKLVMNTAPKGELDVEDFTLTPEQVRQWEAYARKRKLLRWTYYARHLPSGELAGFTEVVYDPDTPASLFQGETGVKPTYRGHGLGKWLKAAMLERVLRDYPDVKDIRTGNANSNAAMLKINEALGFRPYLAQTVWQLKREALEAYLAERS